MVNSSVMEFEPMESYPCIMTSKSEPYLYVLATGEQFGNLIGTVISCDDKYEHGIGYSSRNWLKENFAWYNGIVTLKNK